MHELSIALSIVEGAVEAMEREGGSRVYVVHLKLGPLSGVAKDALNFSYDLACEGTPLEGSRLVIEDVPVVVLCPNCKVEQPLASIQRFCCPMCGTATPDVIQGRELEITGLEVDA
jgi:hydrogenase nickel incorporation protein HypA/HybF